MDSPLPAEVYSQIWSFTDKPWFVDVVTVVVLVMSVMLNVVPPCTYVAVKLAVVSTRTGSWMCKPAVTCSSTYAFVAACRARLGLAEIRVANELDQFRQRKANVVDTEVVSEV